MGTPTMNRYRRQIQTRPSDKAVKLHVKPVSYNQSNIAIRSVFSGLIHESQFICAIAAVWLTVLRAGNTQGYAQPPLEQPPDLHCQDHKYGESRKTNPLFCLSAVCTLRSDASAAPG